jgi:hypothetical protein
MGTLGSDEDAPEQEVVFHFSLRDVDEEGTELKKG